MTLNPFTRARLATEAARLATEAAQVTQTFIVTITADAAEDVGAAMRHAVMDLSDQLGGDADATLKITVTDADGAYVTEHEYDPDL